MYFNWHNFALQATIILRIGQLLEHEYIFCVDHDIEHDSVPFKTFCLV